MGSVEWMIYKEKRIFFLDVSENKNVKESIALSEKAISIITKEPEKSVRLMTDFTNTRYDPEGVEKLKQFSKAVTPYVKARCAVGIVGLKAILLGAVQALTGQKIKTASSRQEALDWLIAQP